MIYISCQVKSQLFSDALIPLKFWKTFVILLTPCLLSPLLMAIGTSEAKCAFVILLMSVYWVLEVVPLPITALLPIVLLPLLGVMHTGEVCEKYLKESNMMFVGGMIVAIAVEHSGLHQRVALRILLAIGTSPRLLMLGFMLPTMFLSMWISNTATTAMMVPIVEAVLSEINGESSLNTIAEDEQVMKLISKKKQKVRVMIYLSVAYAANTGGTGTLTGTGPNLVLKGMLSTLFEGQTPVNFASWMGYAVPTMLVNLFVCWIWLQAFFLGFPGKTKIMIGNKDKIKKILKAKYEDLGPVNFHQLAVFINFLLLVALWFFRDPQFIPGWGEFFSQTKDDDCGGKKKVHMVDDASAALFIVFLLFIFPSKLTFWPFTKLSKSKNSAPLLDWRTVHDRFPWGVMLLFGGGFALADASKISGLSNWVGEQLTILNFLPNYAVVLIVCLMTGFITEVTSNVATANILLPVLAELAVATNTNPLYLMIPATVTCSYAFMLPVATPPNAIVYSASGMKTSEMVTAGFILNLLCIGVNVAAINTYGINMFELQDFPHWANSSSKAQC